MSKSSARLKEAAKLGFGSAFLPRSGLEGAGKSTLALNAGGDVTDLVAGIAAGKPQKKALEPS
ncbi:MAG: hypothetical protein FGM26_13105 [Beijerinckiaceae bacterium]|nr:hypothetical protein [Beijerinckiaceae bacterium]